MHTERRHHPRLTPENLEATIQISWADEGVLEVHGNVVNISYTGIKISLDAPIPKTQEGLLKITLVLPKSQIPLTIQGKIKYIGDDSQYGLVYQEINENELDQLMFECVKLQKNNQGGQSLTFTNH